MQISRFIFSNFFTNRITIAGFRNIRIFTMCLEVLDYFCEPMYSNAYSFRNSILMGGSYYSLPHWLHRKRVPISYDISVEEKTRG